MASVVGLGFVGSAVKKSLTIQKVSPVEGYDKFKNGGMGSLDDCMQTPIMFLCLPTLYKDEKREYNKSAINETLAALSYRKYKGIVVIKSTVEPGTTDRFSQKYTNLNLMHNPEFLTARTAFSDFHNQRHIVIGRGPNCTQEHENELKSFFQTFYSKADISMCSAMESESMKSFVNTFYSVKIQFFNELYLLCEKSGCNFDTVRHLMLKNGWINPMHTDVPGHDGKLSYGGACFPKDTNALLQHMKKTGTPHALLEGCIRERNVLRDEEHLNDYIEAPVAIKNFMEMSLDDPHMTNNFDLLI